MDAPTAAARSTLLAFLLVIFFFTIALFAIVGFLGEFFSKCRLCVLHLFGGRGEIGNQIFHVLIEKDEREAGRERKRDEYPY